MYPNNSKEDQTAGAIWCEHENDDYAKMCDNENDVHRHSASRL